MTTPNTMQQIGERYLLVPAKPAHSSIKPRQADVEEWEASIEGGISNLSMCIAASDEAWTLLYADDKGGFEPQMIWGVVTQGNRMATTWLIGTDQAERDALWLLHALTDHIKDLFSRWPTTECFADIRNKVHHRWLTWMGYKMVERVFMGPQGRQFINFRKEP